MQEYLEHIIQLYVRREKEFSSLMDTEIEMFELTYQDGNSTRRMG